MTSRMVFLRWVGSLLLAGLIVGTVGAIQHQARAWTSAAPGEGHDQQEEAGLSGAPVQAADDSSSAVWSVDDMTFESLYPAGFRFTARITSSAGAIVRGRVIWSHVPGRQSSALIEIDEGTGLLTASWEPGQDNVPPWVGITYYWDVGDAAGNSFQTEPQYVEYEDNTRAWLRSESEDIIVFSEGLPSEVNQLTIDAMAAQRETYRAAWGGLLPYKPRAILFGDRDAWSEWRVGLLDPAVIGETSDHWGGTAQTASSFGGLNDLAYGTVLHEVAHLYQNEFTVMQACTWITEGNATFFELNTQNDYEAYVRNLARSGRLPSLLNGTGPGTCGLNRRLGYNVGYTFWAWLVDNYGLEGHRKLIDLLGEGMPRNAAIEAVTGLSAQEVERQWRIWLGASPVPPTLAPTPTFQFLPSPTPFSFGN
jgi:hypothetical protein